LSSSIEHVDYLISNEEKRRKVLIPLLRDPPIEEKSETEKREYRTVRAKRG